MTENKNNNANFQTTGLFGSSFGSSASKLPNSFDATLDRLKSVFGVKTDTDFANKMGFRQGAVSSAKQKQAIPPAWIMEVALTKGVSADWLLTGEGEMKRGAAAAERPAQLAEDRPIYNDKGEDFDMGEVLAQTIDILNSRTVYTTAIVSNIKAFHKAITTEKKIEDLEANLTRRLDALEAENVEIRARNQQLLEDVDNLRSRLALENTG
jgi:hypothetical protein